MGLLDGGLAQDIYAAFSGQLLTGLFYSRSVPVSGALDRAGDPVDVASAPAACEGFVDLYSEFQHSNGIPEDDLQLSIFAKSMPSVTPAAGDVAKITGPSGSIYAGKWYQVRKQAIDPAGALWVLQSFEISEPEGLG